MSYFGLLTQVCVFLLPFWLRFCEGCKAVGLQNHTKLCLFVTTLDKKVVLIQTSDLRVLDLRDFADLPRFVECHNLQIFLQSFKSQAVVDTFHWCSSQYPCRFDGAGTLHVVTCEYGCTHLCKIPPAEFDSQVRLI